MLVTDDELARASAVSYASFLAVAHQQGVSIMSPNESPEAAVLQRAIENIANRVVLAAGLQDW
jgi:hypothetical protein